MSLLRTGTQARCTRLSAWPSGALVQIHIPRPPPPGEQPGPGVGKVLIEFAESGAAIAARNAMHGRTFAGRTVVATLITEDDYKSQKWD